MKVKYFSDDGKEFPSEQACLKHEASNTVEARIIGALTGGGPKALAFLGAAMRYDATVEGARDLGDALEQAARKCAEARIAAGGAKRKHKGKTDAAPNMGETEPKGPGFTPVDTTGVRAIHERAKNDQPKYPTEGNPFPAHRAAGQVPAAEPT